jgi:hypothetical protein
MSKPWEHRFPNLTPGNWREKSLATESYNCIAWAAGDKTRWWWPDAMNQRHWPQGLPRIVSLDNFIRAYETIGYEKCDDPTVEQGFEKIVIYANASGLPRHAARQLPNGEWTSKLGKSEDIEHVTVQVLECRDYGRPFQFMKRRMLPT